MGSAVCFPVESAVFLAAVAASIIGQEQQPFSNARLGKVCREITVYGDDIIAPTRYIPGIMRDLRKLGFIPNESKSFYRSYFREACGLDAYAGVPVKPVYLRVDFWTRSRLSSEDVVSLIDTSRQAVDAGLIRYGELLLDLVENQLGKLPYSETVQSHLTHNLIWRDAPSERRWNTELQKMMVKGYRPIPNMVQTSLDGYDRLLRYLVRGQNNQHEPDILNPADEDWTKVATRGFKLKRFYA
jgi:hypothetical protein